MLALQKAFSRHEKIKRMLGNLDEMKQKGEVGDEQYVQLKTQYDSLLEQALANLKDIRARLKTEREQAQTDLDKLSAQAKDIEVRGKIGELAPEQVAKAIGAIQSRRDDCQKNVQRMETWLKARSSLEIGGFMEVDVSQAVEYKSEGRLDWDNLNNLLGGITRKISEIDGEKVVESLGNVVGQVYKKAGEVNTRTGGKSKLMLFGGIAAIVLALAALMIFKSLLGGGSTSAKTPKLTEKTILALIEKQWEKDPPYFDMDINWPAQLQLCAKAGLLVASDPAMNSFHPAMGMENLIAGDAGMFKMHLGQPENLKLLRFTPPAMTNGMMVSYAEYQYNWKPTEILTSGKFQELRDAIRQQLAQAEPKLKIPVASKIAIGLFTDGWSVLE